MTVIHISNMYVQYTFVRSAIYGSAEDVLTST